MSFIEVSAEIEFDEKGETAFIKDLKAIKGVDAVEISKPMALGAATVIVIGIVIGVVKEVIPVIISIAKQLMTKPRIIKFECSEPKKTVKIHFEGIENEDKIAEMVKYMYETTCGNID